MAKFLNRFDLIGELRILIEESKDCLILISPYIKLSPELIQILSVLKRKKHLKLIIVYGKNEDDKRKSLSDYDMNFFKSFPNVEIRYHKRLHAKLYANENKCLITSMNLHEHSIRENIEFGILTKAKNLDTLTSIASELIDGIPEALDTQAMKFVDYIVEKSTLEYEKTFKIEKKFFGLISKPIGSIVNVNKSRTGFCIRTHETIPFNPQSPYSYNAYQVWAKYENPNFTENFCHGCGKKHPASMAYPLCRICYKEYHM